jgi:high-affinity iron transporter
MGTFVITLREGFEASLIVCLIFAYLQKTGQVGAHRRAVWSGVTLAALTSVGIGALLFATVGELHGRSERIYEGSAMIVAAAVVTWMVFWMRRQAATIGQHLRSQVSESLRVGGGLALAGVAFIGVAREGLETALFLFASARDSGVGVSAVAGLAGLAGAVALGVLFYRGTVRLDIRRFFTVTSFLVIGFAAYLLFGGIHELGEIAGSEALETAVPLAAALAYGAGFAALYLRDARRPVRPEPARTEPTVGTAS